MFLVNGLQVGPQIFATEPLYLWGAVNCPREFIFGMFAAGLLALRVMLLLDISWLRSSVD